MNIIAEEARNRDPAQKLPAVDKMTIGYLLFNWIRQSWDEMGCLLLGSFLFSVPFFVGILFPCSVLARQFGETGPPPLASLAPFFVLMFLGLWVVLCAWCSLNRYVEQILTFQYPAWTELFRSLPRYILPSLKILLFLGICFGVLAFNAFTYPKMLPEMPLVRLVAVTLTVWVILIVAILQVHLAPFIVHQDRPFFTLVKRAGLIALWKPFRSLLILVFQVFAILFSFVPPFCFVLPGIYAVLSNLSLLILLEDWHDPYEKTREALRAGA